MLTYNEWLLDGRTRSLLQMNYGIYFHIEYQSYGHKLAHYYYIQYRPIYLLQEYYFWAPYNIVMINDCSVRNYMWNFSTEYQISALIDVKIGSSL